MPASVTLNVELNDRRAIRGLEEIARAIKPLTTTIKLDVDTSKALRSIKDLNDIALKAEKQLSKIQVGNNVLGTGHNAIDEAIRHSENASRAFSEALQKQIAAEREAADAHRDMASSMTVIDQAIDANERASRRFSEALRKQMEEEAATKARRDKFLADEAAASERRMSALKVAFGTLISHGVMYAARKVAQATREALDEMKNVDTELTNISKVSGKTGAELQKIGEGAHETATRYGVAASEYLQAVYAMQKAGMGDQSEAMGELAVKTMLVGDTTQDVATKFLLATNAAWKLEGNMTRLGQIVDEADYINNNYATSLDKLAAGMPIVASVAENAGMSAEETMAALGTITAATQESGTKAATALRALILNISKEVGTFVTEEGEEFQITEESIKTVQGLLEKYAKTELDAAKASGELIDPMTAIRAIFKGMAEDDLNDVELFNLLSGMGGKLRTNQLTALVKNFETLYTDMMGNIKDATGTADNEIDLMMNSWNKKTQVLKNSWTELVANVLSTDTIKSAIDGLSGTIQNLTDMLFPDEHPQQTLYDNLFAEYESLKGKGGDLNGIEQARLEYLEKQLEVMKQQANLENEQAAKKTQEKLTEDGYWSGYNEKGEAVGFTGYTSRDQAVLNDLRGQYRELSHLAEDFDIEEFQDSLKGLVDTNEEYYQSLVSVEEAGVPLTAQQKEFKDLYEAIDTASKTNIKDFADLGDGLRALYDDTGNLVSIVDTSELPEKFNMQEQMQDSGAALKELNSAIETLAGDLAEASGLNGEVAEGAGAITYDGATSSASGLLGVLKAIANISFPGMTGMGAIGFGAASALGTENAPGGPTLVNELGPELISDRGKAYIANGGKPGVVNLHRGAIVIPADQTKEALKGGMPKYARASAWDFMGAGARSLALAQRSQAQYDVPDDVLGTSGITSSGLVYKPTRQNKSTITSKVGKGGKGSGSGGGGGGATAKSVEDLAKETKDILSNIEKQAKLADNRKQYDKEVSLWEKGQREIDKMVAQYKKAGYKETDDEVLDLLNKRFDYDKKREAASKKAIEEAASELKDKLGNLDKQAKLADTNGDYEKEVRFYETAQEAIKEMVGKYRAAGYADDSDEILDLLQKNVDYGEKQVKIYKDRWNALIDALDADTEAQEAANALAEKEQALADAREALANASKQRTVRTYNAATGQWEWVADQSKVKSAQDTLTKAEENYSKEVKDQAIKELERLRDTMADLNDVILGPALSAIMSQAESSDTFQNFARALNGVYGVGSFLASTEGSSKVLSTADSHDTFYTFGNVTLTEEEASSMSVAQLAQRLQVLKIS